MSIETTKPASSNPPSGVMDEPHPPRLKASWIDHVQLAIGRVGCGWIDRIELAIGRVESALSSHPLELSRTSPDQTISCLISIGVTVETLR